MSENDPFKNRDDDSVIYSKLKNIQTLTTVSMFSGPVSLLFGGVLLSSVALACSIVAKVKLGNLKTSSEDTKDLVRNLNTQCMIALVISVVATLLNVISFVITFMSLYSVLQSGDTEQLMNLLSGNDPSIFNGTSTGETGSSDISIWDK